ncbi:hypothetical protein SRHO_G00095780 [Serrasalmus rhombeus]
MPFGISSAPEIFHRAMESIIEGIDGVRVYVDDIVLWGSTLAQHNERLTKVLQSFQKYGLKLNMEKCQFAVKELMFLGDELSEFGVEPDRAKVQAILDMPRPTDKKAVLRVMGMINLIGKFILNLSSRTMHLRELLHHANEFKWTAKHETEWESLKTILTTEPVLTFFDPSKPTKISTDASKNGLDAVLLQATGDSKNPVAYASRIMTSSERNYAQIEKECLGLVYGLEKFHSYVYGLPTFVAETDHKPLIAIIKKNLSEMSPRIQRLMMKLQCYDFELIYTPGKYIVLGGALSRAPQHCEPHNESSTEKDVNLHVNLVLETLPVSDMKSKWIAVETAKDKEFQTFAETYDFQHVTSSPLYVQSNGKAEKGVHIVKRLLKKAKDSNADPYLALLSYRASPLEHGISPALMRRKLRTTLPYIAGHKQNRYLKQKQERLRRREKENYDKSAQALKPLSRHDTVRIGDTNNWNTKATVLDEVSPRSYTVRTEDGQILRRNHRSLLKTQETLQEQLGE